MKGNSLRDGTRPVQGACDLKKNASLMGTIAVLGTFDTKGVEHAFLAEKIREQGHRTLLIDVGTGSAPQVSCDLSRDDVAQAGKLNLSELTTRGDRGECVTAMSQAAPILLEQLRQSGRIQGVISLGGGGGTAIATAAMRALPIGFPKVMVSTLASGKTDHYLGTKDIVMMPAIVDISGLNRISKAIFTRAAGAISGMVNAEPEVDDSRPIIAASMFGNTTDCIAAAQKLLDQAGYEVLVFHATGTGGRAMESLIQSGYVSGVLDVTTTELADEIVGGTLSAGPERMQAAAAGGVPSIVAPGCLDMVNFGAPETVPRQFSQRRFYHHNPQVTLMRTTPVECRQIGSILGQKINACSAPVTVLIPLQGVSVISAPGQPFYDPEADAALFQALTSTLRPEIDVVKLDCNINHPDFAQTCVETLLENIRLTLTR